MTNEPHNWKQIVAKLRRATGLGPPTLEEADAAMASADEIPISDEQVDAIVRRAMGTEQARPLLEQDLSWLDDVAEDSRVDESRLVLNRNKGDDDEEIQQHLEQLRRRALESDEEEDDEDGLEGDRNTP